MAGHTDVKAIKWAIFLSHVMFKPADYKNHLHYIFFFMQEIKKSVFGLCFCTKKWKSRFLLPISVHSKCKNVEKKSSIYIFRKPSDNENKAQTDFQQEKILCKFNYYNHLPQI